MPKEIIILTLES